MTEPNGFIYSFHFDKMRKKYKKREQNKRWKTNNVNGIMLAPINILAPTKKTTKNRIVGH